MMLPELIVFDLDFTLWDCGGTWCDCLTPPFNQKQGRVNDGRGKHIRLYSDVVSILDFCSTNGITTALASRTEQPVWARQLLELLGATDRFAFAEIYPSSKLKHFAALYEKTKIEYGQMLFFDDEMRNIQEVSELGVTCLFVEDGLTRQVFDEGLTKHSARSNM
ncbi:MAG: hypothetical protein Aurels2KO_14080 [Aureliella sp.]